MIFILFFNVSSICHLLALLRVPHLMLSVNLQVVLEVILIENKNKQFFPPLRSSTPPPPHPSICTALNSVLVHHFTSQVPLQYWMSLSANNAK